MYSSGYGYGGPGAFGFSLTSSSLKKNPHVLEDWQRPHFNLKKAANVSREIERHAREKELGDRSFRAIGFDMQQSISKAFPKSKFPLGEEGETTREDLQSGIDQISKYIQGEKHRFDAEKHGILGDEHWKGQYDNAVEMEKEWNELKESIEDDMAPRIKAVVAPKMRADYIERKSQSGSGKKKRTRKRSGTGKKRGGKSRKHNKRTARKTRTKKGKGVKRNK